MTWWIAVATAALVASVYVYARLIQWRAPELEDIGEGFPDTVHADAGGHVRVVDATENPIAIAAVGVNPLQIAFEQTEQGHLYGSVVRYVPDVPGRYTVIPGEQAERP